MKTLFAFFLVFPMASWAEIPDAPPTIPVESVENVDPTPIPPPRFELTPQLSALTLSELSLSGPSGLDLLPSAQGMPTFSLTLGRPLLELGRFTFSLQASVGYGQFGGQPLLQRQSTTPTPVRALHWIPIGGSMRVSYRWSTFPTIRPAIVVGAGNLTLIQTSSSSASQRTTNLPYLTLSPQLMFVDLSAFHWLGGFTFGATLIRDLSSHSTVSATSFDLSLCFLL